MSISIIDTIYDRSLRLLKYLDSQRELTYRSDFDEDFKKTLVLSISSYLEHLICETILKFTDDMTTGNQVIYSFIKNKAISRQYHTFFDWDGRNANRFLSLFGEDFKMRCEKRITSDTAIDDAVRAFLELGRTRNAMVHLNFAKYQLPKTSEEYYDLYRKALKFIKFIEEELNNSVHKTME